MALFDTTWYLNSVGYAAVTAWAAAQTFAAGDLRRPTAPTAANERVFICIVAGAGHATTEPTWVNSRGAKTTDNAATWQECTGASAINGDVTNTPASSSVRSLVITLGAIIKNNAATHYFICSTGGTAGAGEPTFDTTAGNTTADNTATWTCIGAVGNFTGGQGPHSRLTNALASGWFVNGNTVFVGNNHAETQAAAISTTAGNLNVPLRMICHNAAGSYPPAGGDITTGARIITTGANAITIGGSGVYCEGVQWECGTGATNVGITIGGQASFHKFKNCSLQKLGTSGTISAISGANVPSRIELENTTVKFGNVGDSIRMRNNSLKWHSTGPILASGSSVPVDLFENTTTGGVMGDIHLEDLDLSQCTGNIILNVAGAQEMHGNHVIKNCKLNATTVLTNTVLTPSVAVDAVNCDSGDVNYNNQRHRYQGVLTTETTIVRTGGASDGVTPIAHKIVTNANNRWEWPFECFPIAIWNETVGSPVTATVEGIWGGGAVPNNDDIWIDASYLGDASSPLGSKASGTKASIQATGSALAAGSGTWGGSTTKFKMTVTFTPQQKGFIYIQPMVGRASSTFYIDPKVVLS